MQMSLFSHAWVNKSPISIEHLVIHWIDPWALQPIRTTGKPYSLLWLEVGSGLDLNNEKEDMSLVPLSLLNQITELH
jgi:hypothetical protein